MAEPRIMSEREFGRMIGFQEGTTIKGEQLARFRKQYDQYYKEAISGWRESNQLDPEGNIIRVNPVTGQSMVVTNAITGAQQKAQPRSGAMDPYAAYMNPAGVAGAAVDTNSAAFAGVQPSQVTGASAQGTANPVTPVNVNPAVPTMQRTAEPAVPTGQTNAAAAPAPTPAPTPVANRVRVTAAEFEQTYGRKVQPGTAFPYKNEQGQTIAVIEVE